ncbi:VOC family protein [Asanoa siamensis]|uniref:Glyoxalase n=1 Tax=Asanoa siamensis TaxID=926357 RepID=A0ABQ4CT54_9ACTN|nr:VOC family protein [Asanoa siamensis]GIF74473.1 glyoxalase [Asanoa siamensis]
MSVGAVSQIHVSVSELERSVRFYRDVLGIPFLFDVPGQSMAFFQSGDVRLYLGVPESEAFASKVTLYFTVDDLVAERERLAKEGVSFLDEPHLVHRDDTGELWMTFFRDPDGHNLALTETRPG